MQTLIKDKNGDVTTTKIQLWIIFIIAIPVTIPAVIVLNIYGVEVQASLLTYVGGLFGSGVFSYGFKKYMNYKEDKKNDTES